MKIEQQDHRRLRLEGGDDGVAGFASALRSRAVAATPPAAGAREAGERAARQADRSDGSLLSNWSRPPRPAAPWMLVTLAPPRERERLPGPLMRVGLPALDGRRAAGQAGGEALRWPLDWGRRPR